MKSRGADTPLGSALAHLRHTYLMITMLTVGCAVGTNGALTSTAVDARARATLRALRETDAAALDTLVLASTRESGTFHVVAGLAVAHFPGTVAEGARLIGSELKKEGAAPLRFRATYSFETPDESIQADLWFVESHGVPVVETIEVSGKRRP